MVWKCAVAIRTEETLRQKPSDVNVNAVFVSYITAADFSTQNQVKFSWHFYITCSNITAD